MLGRLFEAAVKLAQAAVELLARGVQAAPEEQPDQGEPGAQRLHVHLGFLAVDEPLPEQTHQKLRHRGGTQSENTHPHKHDSNPLSRSCCTCNRRVRATPSTSPASTELRVLRWAPSPGDTVEALRCGLYRCSARPSALSAVQECAPLKSPWLQQRLLYWHETAHLRQLINFVFYK